METTFNLSYLKLSVCRTIEVCISGNPENVTRVSVQARDKRVILEGPRSVEVLAQLREEGYDFTDKANAHKVRPNGTYYNVLVGTKQQTAPAQPAPRTNWRGHNARQWQATVQHPNNPQPAPRNAPRVRTMQPTVAGAAQTLKTATAEMVEAARVLKAHEEAEALKAKRSAAARKGWQTRKAAQQ